MGNCYICGKDRPYRGATGNTRNVCEARDSKDIDRWRKKILLLEQLEKEEKEKQ